MVVKLVIADGNPGIVTSLEQHARQSRGGVIHPKVNVNGTHGIFAHSHRNCDTLPSSAIVLRSIHTAKGKSVERS